MNDVWIVSFDESEDASDPLLRAFADQHSAYRAVRQMGTGTPFSNDIERELDTLTGSFTLNYLDVDEGARCQIHVHAVPVEHLGDVWAKGRL